MHSATRGKNARTFVRRSHRARTDRDLAQVMAVQSRVLDAIERTRLRCALSVEQFASLAGIAERSYRRAMSGMVLVRAATIARLRTAQKRALRAAQMRRERGP
jgi:hypothetical protein